MPTRYIVFSILPLILQTVGLVFFAAGDPYISKKRRSYILIIAAFNAILIVADYLETLYASIWYAPTIRTVLSIVGYSIRPIIILLFICVLAPDQQRGKWWCLAAVNILIHLTALFSNICFYITEENSFRRGPLGYSCHIVSGILLAYLMVLTFRIYRRKKRDAWVPLINELLIIFAVIADSTGIYWRFPVTFLTVGITSCSLFQYFWLHLQFVRDHEDALQAEQRIQIMMTQIQPHFLYNTLATISALCRKDPDAASVMTEKFSAYLRQNLDTLNEKQLIPFAKELEHTRIYTDIEMTRFDNISVVFDIQDSDFFLPPLTLQPLVENAIRHGVRGREKGTVTVITRLLSDCHEMIIQDNGEGFDVRQIDKLDAGHIGISNVRERLEKLCGGSLTMESTAGQGTTVTVKIPLFT